jgi:hypothetical protein
MSQPAPLKACAGRGGDWTRLRIGGRAHPGGCRAMADQVNGASVAAASAGMRCRSSGAQRGAALYVELGGAGGRRAGGAP